MLQANFPGEYVKEIMQKKPTWRILLVGENAIPPVTGDLEVMKFQSIDYKARWEGNAIFSESKRDALFKLSGCY